MHSIRQIAEDFSNGKFESVYDNLSENVEWHVFGERIVTGKKAVIENCEQTASYFKSVTTDFKTYNIIEGALRIAINGRAEFIRNGKTLSVVNACDVYEFNNEGNLLKICSYCIPEKEFQSGKK